MAHWFVHTRFPAILLISNGSCFLLQSPFPLDCRSGIARTLSIGYSLRLYHPPPPTLWSKDRQMHLPCAHGCARQIHSDSKSFARQMIWSPYFATDLKRAFPLLHRAPQSTPQRVCWWTLCPAGYPRPLSSRPPSSRTSRAAVKALRCTCLLLSCLLHSLLSKCNPAHSILQCVLPSPNP